MAIEITPHQQRFILRLILWQYQDPIKEPTLTESSAWFSKDKKGIAERNQLIELRLAKQEQRGRSRHIIPEDRAWEWVQEHVFALQVPESKKSCEVLQVFLQKLGGYLFKHFDANLSEIFISEPCVDKVIPTTHQKQETPSEPLETQIRMAYFELSTEQTDRQIRLADLRKKLHYIPKEELDGELIKLYGNCAISRVYLYELVNRQEITDEDIQAALQTGGANKHIIIITSS